MIQRIPGLPASDMDDVFEQLVVYQVLMRTTPTPTIILSALLHFEHFECFEHFEHFEHIVSGESK